MGKEEKLIMLRMELFAAMKTLQGDELAEFWKLIDDVNSCRAEVS